jgi:hypothetical protein
MPTICGILYDFASEVIGKAAIDLATIHAEHLSKFDCLLVWPLLKGLEDSVGQRWQRGIYGIIWAHEQDSPSI